MRLGCILLAAGCGRRFGGNKLTFPIDGVSMLERACVLHAALHYDACVLVARPEDAFAADCAARFGFTLCLNARYAFGIGTSAAAGMASLTAACGALDGALFGVCDQPYLTSETVRVLAARFMDAPDRIVAPTCGGKRGNPVIFPRALFPAFLSLDGDVGGSAVLRAHSELLLTVPVDCPRELFDIDTRAAADDSGN